MEIKELGHLVLYVRNLERSAHFYRDVLGWRQVAPDPGASRGGLRRLFGSIGSHAPRALALRGRRRRRLPAQGSASRALPLRPEGRRYRRRAARSACSDHRGRRHDRRIQRPHRYPQPLRPRPRRQRDRTVRRRARCRLAIRTRSRHGPCTPVAALSSEGGWSSGSGYSGHRGIPTTSDRSNLRNGARRLSANRLASRNTGGRRPLVLGAMKANSGGIAGNGGVGETGRDRGTSDNCMLRTGVGCER